ncbi:hypothetical protein ACFQ6H_04010 [Rhodococcus sp. NPDC056506]|uniref:hypothetical protein n=1 Tax=Rhodococcus sp. NPDC056506 TaxID=3345844 RepID=UPI003672BC83
MQNSVRSLSTDLDRAAEVLGEAFADYPWTNWCVAEDSHVERVAAINGSVSRSQAKSH